MSKKFRILLDAGHGQGRAHNRGSVCSNEGDNNYRYSLVLRDELGKIPGVTVSLTRNSIGQNPSLSTRSSKGKGYDLFLSLHSNAGTASARGTEVWDSVERRNKSLASKLSKAISGEFGHNDRGVKYKEGRPGWNWYGVLRGNKAKSAMIIEHGFHTNRADCNYFVNNHRSIAKVTANVIRNHYGLGKGTSGGSNVSNVYYGVGSPHNTKSAVRKLQKDLVALGHSVGKYGTNGVMGKDTRAGIISFQKKHGLSVDGFAGQATLSRIEKELAKKKKSGALSIGDNNDRVKQLQKDLIALGYGVGDVGANGAFGSLTERAVKRLQDDHKELTSNGVVGSRTMARIKKELAKKNKPTYRVQVGAYSNRKNAEQLVAELKKKGYDAIIKTS